MFNRFRRAVIIAAALASTASAADVNQSFKDWKSVKGRWIHNKDIYAQVEGGNGCLSFPKFTGWTDYTYELEARKISGTEGFLILFRASDKNNYYWWNLGGWRNSAHAIESQGRGGKGNFPKVRGSIKNGKWYRVGVKVAGASIKCYLNGKLIHDVIDHRHKAGGIALGSWSTQVQYKNIRVTTPDGKVLYRTRRTEHSPDMDSFTRKKLTPEEKAKLAAERARLLKLTRNCPPIAFIKRRDYGMHGTNATMFARRTGKGR